jgi:hypothetical protein
MQWPVFAPDAVWPRLAGAALTMELVLNRSGEPKGVTLMHVVFLIGLARIPESP